MRTMGLLLLLLMAVMMVLAMAHSVLGRRLWLHCSGLRSAHCVIDCAR